MIDTAQLLELLPHRFPFLLVDRITELEPGVRVTGIKTVSADEALFSKSGHERMVMPGLLIIEALAQTGAVLLLLGSAGAAGKLVYFAALDNVTWSGVVRPGDVLRLEITVVHARGRLRKVHGVASVASGMVCEADMSAVVVDRDT